MGEAINQLVKGNPDSGASQQVIGSAVHKMETMGFSKKGAIGIYGGSEVGPSDTMLQSIAAEKQKEEMERRKTRMDTQDRIHEIQAQVTQSRAATNQRLFQGLIDSVFGK